MDQLSKKSFISMVLRKIASWREKWWFIFQKPIVMPEVNIGPCFRNSAFMQIRVSEKKKMLMLRKSNQLNLECTISYQFVSWTPGLHCSTSVHKGADDGIRSVLNLWDFLGERTGAQRKQRREGRIIHEELNSIYQESVLCSYAGWSPELLHL